MSQAQEPNRRLPVVIGAAQGAERAERRRRPRGEAARSAAYYSHVLGQSGARRGLKGGQAVIDQAHSTYLGAEWSGSADRRRLAGGLLGARI